MSGETKGAMQGCNSGGIAGCGTLQRVDGGHMR